MVSLKDHSGGEKIQKKGKLNMFPNDDSVGMDTYSEYCLTEDIKRTVIAYIERDPDASLH